jgi:hypothetical protein
MMTGTTDDFVRVSFPAPPDAPRLVANLGLVRVEEAGRSGVSGTFERAVAWEEADPRR